MTEMIDETAVETEIVTGEGTETDGGRDLLTTANDAIMTNKIHTPQAASIGRVNAKTGMAAAVAAVAVEVAAATEDKTENGTATVVRGDEMTTEGHAETEEEICSTTDEAAKAAAADATTTEEAVVMSSPSRHVEVAVRPQRSASRRQISQISSPSLTESDA